MTGAGKENRRATSRLVAHRRSMLTVRETGQHHRRGLTRVGPPAARHLFVRLVDRLAFLRTVFFFFLEAFRLVDRLAFFFFLVAFFFDFLRLVDRLAFFLVAFFLVDLFFVDRFFFLFTVAFFLVDRLAVFFLFAI